MQKKLIIFCLACLLLTACSKKPEYVIMPSGTHETQAPVIYTPNGEVGDQKAVPTESTESAENQTQDTAYKTRLSNTWSLLNKPSLLISSTVSKVENGVSSVQEITIAYNEKYNYVKLDDLTVISNRDFSYLLDTSGKKAYKAPQGTFAFTQSSEILKLFAPLNATYKGTSEKQYSGLTLICDAFVSDDGTTYNMCYTPDDILLLTESSFENTQSSWLLSNLTECTDNSYFEIDSDYVVSDYVKN